MRGGKGGSRGRENIYIYIKLWLLRVVVWQKPTQHCKTIFLQLKKKRSNSIIRFETHVLVFKFSKVMSRPRKLVLSTKQELGSWRERR